LFESLAEAVIAVNFVNHCKEFSMMVRVRDLTFVSIFSVLLLLSAGCVSQDGNDPGGNTANTAPANSNVSTNSNINIGRKLTEQEGSLLMASAKGETKTVKDLLDKGVYVDTRDADSGTTPLGHAVWGGHADTARLLIERGADVNAKTNEGLSVLTFATMQKHKDLADMLKKAGAK
jgi:ankyrin repeat protein